jgi:phenylacetate-coenzyme A ligase PaaK-like adenylate-forming protein
MNSEKLLDSYVEMADTLLYQDEAILRYYQDFLEKNIVSWALEHSNVYKTLYEPDRIFTKDDLLDKDNWYVSQLKESSGISSTSGSTTGDPFSYAIYNRYAKFLIDDQHWNLILREFSLNDHRIKITILYYFKDTLSVFPDDSFVRSDHSVSSQFQYNHGSKDCSVDYINFKQFGSSDWYDQLFNYLRGTEIDIIISTGPIINQFCEEIRRRKYSKKLCCLLSHSNEFPLQRDFEFLKINKLIDYHCDHMRCWDGGATFFTCKFGTYHLLDNITYHKSVDNKLVTTDYFSLSAPFINYWNGDLCKIENEYLRCECGRLYRPFKMLENRPFALKGSSKLTSIKQQISQLSFKRDLIQVQFENLSVRISCSRELETNEKDQLQNILIEYQIIFC